MNVGKFIRRICLILIVLLVVGIVIRLFQPKLQQLRALRESEAAGKQNLQEQADQLRLLMWKQEKLQEDPSFIEKTAREELGYAKPGETVFRFVDEDDR